MERIADLYNSVAGIINLNGREDRLEWDKDKRGHFSVNFAYKELNIAGAKERDWPWKMIWKPKIPYKINCFIWLLAKEAVLTHENLNKGPQLASRCVLCGDQVETINHLFLQCKWTDQLWRMFISMKGIKWVKPGSIADVLRCWNIDGNVNNKEKRWKIVPSCIWWTVWTERNKRSFEGMQSSLQSFKMNCLGFF